MLLVDSDQEQLRTIGIESLKLRSIHNSASSEALEYGSVLKSVAVED